jgi:peptide/nickel transport system substrate-binding protein
VAQGPSSEAFSPGSQPPVAPGTAPAPSSKRKWIIIGIVAVLIVAAIGGIFLYLQGSGPTLKVQTTTVFATAGEAVSFEAVITGPAPTAVNWNFGDGTSAVSTGTTVAHTFSAPGTFFVEGEANLSGGSKVNNFGALYPMTVGPAKDLTTRDSLGLITINRTASAAGAPTIAPGGTIVGMGAVQQPPTYFFSTSSTPGGLTVFDNYTWAVKSLSFSFGDGSAALTNQSDAPLHFSHAYSSAGLYALTLSVTTQNMTIRNTCNATSCSETNPTPVTPSQTRTTVAGQTIAVGTYKLVTYSGSIINPGLIVVQEAVTGSYTTLDPSVDYESVGSETIQNTYQTLLYYNGSKTSEFVPVLADRIPSVADGTISADHKNYTFHLRPGAIFADGTPVTPWDVKYSFTRTMLFVFGSPGTSGWIQSQYLLPSLSTSDLTFANVNGAVDVNNASGTVTFHLRASVPELLWFQIISDPLGSSISSWRWLEAHGPALTWTPAGFASYQKYGSLPDYVPYWRDHTMGSGPFIVDYVVPGESVAMKRNPNFQPVPGIPAPKVDRVFLQYVGEDSTRELSLESGQADITTYNPSSRFPAMQRMQTAGLVNIEFVPTLNLFWWNFNMEIAQPNPDNNVPSDFFVDLNMRKAFFNAYDFQGYLDNIVGNKLLHAKFADSFNGIIPNGMIGYENLSSYNIFNLTKARESYNKTTFVLSHGGWATAAFHLTIVVPTADPVNLAAARAWGDNIQKLGPPGNIVIDTRQRSFHDIIAETVPHSNHLALWYLGWLPDYPYPTDYTYPMLEPGNAQSEYGGTYPASNGFNISYLQSKGELVQARAAQNISDWINATLTETDLNRVIQLSRMAQREAMLNLTIYVPAQQQYSFYVSRRWIQGMESETSVMQGGSDLFYNVLSKTSSVGTSSASGGLGSQGLDAFGISVSFIGALLLGTRSYGPLPSTRSMTSRRREPGQSHR